MFSARRLREYRAGDGLNLILIFTTTTPRLNVTYSAETAELTANTRYQTVSHSAPPHHLNIHLFDVIFLFGSFPLRVCLFFLCLISVRQTMFVLPLITVTDWNRGQITRRWTKTTRGSCSAAELRRSARKNYYKGGDVLRFNFLQWNQLKMVRSCLQMTYHHILVLGSKNP